MITTGNHVWDQKETLEHIKTEKRLLRPINLQKESPGMGFGIYNSKRGFKMDSFSLRSSMALTSFLDIWAVYPAISVNMIAASFLSVVDDIEII